MVQHLTTNHEFEGSNPVADWHAEKMVQKKVFCEYQPSGLYYKHVTIVIDAASVVVTLKIVASLMIVIDDAS